MTPLPQGTRCNKRHIHPSEPKQGITMIETRHLFDIALTVPSIVDLGQTPLGGRKIATVTGGEFSGQRLRGTVHPSVGGDWLLMRGDGVLTLDVRLTLQTDDGALIHMRYQGLRHGPEDIMAKVNRGEAVPAGSYYFRVTPTFETAAPAYAWLNGLLAVGTGERTAQGPRYQVYEIC